MYHNRYGYNEILLGHEKKESLPPVTIWLEPERIMLSDLSQTEQDKDHTSHYMWNLNTKKNKAMRRS